MVRFPETVAAEWKIVAEAEKATIELRKRIARGTQIENKLEKIRIDYEAKQLHQQELDADQTPALEMMTLKDYLANPAAAAPADLIEGVVKDNGLCIILASSGIGKSTISLQMLHSLLTGLDFLGKPAQHINAAGFVSYDMDAAIVMDWMAGAPGVDPAKLSVVNAYKKGNPLGVSEMRKQIADAWRAMGVDVVVLDSFSASFRGHDQNDAAETMAHYRDMKLFALDEVGARALIVVTHAAPDKPGKARGSSVHHDVADSILSIEKLPKVNNQRKLTMEKYRALRGQTEMTPVVITEPDPVTHLVDLDPGAMALENLSLPAGAGAQMFPDETPDPSETPEAQDSEEDEGEDDL